MIERVNYIIPEEQNGQYLECGNIVFWGTGRRINIGVMEGEDGAANRGFEGIGIDFKDAENLAVSLIKYAARRRTLYAESFMERVKVEAAKIDPHTCMIDYDYVKYFDPYDLHDQESSFPQYNAWEKSLSVCAIGADFWIDERDLPEESREIICCRFKEMHPTTINQNDASKGETKGKKMTIDWANESLDAAWAAFNSVTEEERETNTSGERIALVRLLNAAIETQGILIPKTFEGAVPKVESNGDC